MPVAALRRFVSAAGMRWRWLWKDRSVLLGNDRRRTQQNAGHAAFHLRRNARADASGSVASGLCLYDDGAGSEFDLGILDCSQCRSFCGPSFRSRALASVSWLRVDETQALGETIGCLS